MPPGDDLIDGAPDAVPELHHVEGLRRVQNVDQVMRNALHLLLRDLRSADIHPAVDLHGVGADDLSADPLRKLH